MNERINAVLQGRCVPRTDREVGHLLAGETQLNAVYGYRKNQAIVCQQRAKILQNPQPVFTARCL